MVKEGTPLENPKRSSALPTDHSKINNNYVPTVNLGRADKAVLKRAREIQANLEVELPSFLKHLTKSVVVGGAMVYNARIGADEKNVPSQKAGSEKSLPQHTRGLNIKHKAVRSKVVVSKDFLLFTDEGVLSSRPPPEFEDVHSFNDFKIVINGLHIDTLLSKQVRTKYYDLCCSRESYIHEKILEDVNNSAWAASIICTTVQIADDTRALTYSTPTTEYARWKNLLHNFEALGMSVGFISAKLSRIEELSVVETLRMEVEEAGSEILGAEEHIGNLEMEVSVLKRKREELAHGMETKRKILEDRKQSFEEEVNAPW